MGFRFSLLCVLNLSSLASRSHPNLKAQHSNTMHCFATFQLTTLFHAKIAQEQEKKRVWGEGGKLIPQAAGTGASVRSGLGVEAHRGGLCCVATLGDEQ